MAQSNFKYIIIDSRDKIKGNSNDFTVTLNPAFNNVKKVELLSLSLPQTIYNINSTNNVIYFNETGPLLSTTITPGNYSASILASTIASTLTTASPNLYTYTSSISNLTYKMTITSTGNFSLLFGSNILNSIGPFIGYTIDTISALSQISNGIILLYQPSYYIIDILELPVSTKSSNVKDFGTFVINTRTNSGDIEIFEVLNRYHIIESYDNQNIYQLNIKLKTYNNVLVDLNGAEWFMLLRFYY